MSGREPRVWPSSCFTVATRSPVVRSVAASRLLSFGVTLGGAVVVVDVDEPRVLFEGSPAELHDVLTSYARDCAQLDAYARESSGGAL